MSLRNVSESVIQHFLVRNVTSTNLDQIMHDRRIRGSQWLHASFKDWQTKEISRANQLHAR